MADDVTPSTEVILSNERTFLAWIRTSLAFVATGVALKAFEVPVPEFWLTVSATIFVLLGIAAAIQSWVGWRATDAAARAGRPMPPPVTRTVLAVGTIVAIAVVGIGLVIG